MNFPPERNEVLRIFLGIYSYYVTNRLYGTQVFLAQKKTQWRHCSTEQQRQSVIQTVNVGSQF